MPDYEIIFTVEDERECGYRKPGADGVGIYLVGGGEDAVFDTCERLPYPLVTCPCCGGGIKFSRSFTWINPIKLFSDYQANPCHGRHDDGAGEVHFDRGGMGFGDDGEHNHDRCAMCHPERFGDKAGLLWVGQKHYSPERFMMEAMRQGISRKVPSVPRGFVVGQHIIYLAHIAACVDINEDGEIVRSPGVFMSFRPRRVDLVVGVDDVEDLPERAKNLKDSLGDNARIVRVLNSDTAPNLELDADQEEDE